MSKRRPQRGFTLIEVLIALAIVAVALAACIRALGLSVDGVSSMHERSLAQQAAQNFLAEMRLEGIFPSLGKASMPCAQGMLALQCEQRVQATPNANFRRVTVTVTLADGPVLAELDGLASRLQ